MTADVYSLGCVLWATLTGRAPYAGTTADQIAAAHREQPIPQLTGGTTMAREVNRILRRAMAKDPARRHRSAAELRDDLRRAASIPDDEPRPAAVRRLASGAAAVMVAASIGYAMSSTRGGDGPTRAGERARAVSSLARALASQGVMTRAEAGCTAVDRGDRARARGRGRLLRRRPHLRRPQPQRDDTADRVRGRVGRPGLRCRRLARLRGVMGNAALWCLPDRCIGRGVTRTQRYPGRRPARAPTSAAGASPGPGWRARRACPGPRQRSG
jgi:hypothetical protein